MKTTKKSDYRDFLAQFVKNPRAIGAIAPSSNGLSRRISDLVDWNNVTTVLEYGPGTGVLTQHILNRLQPHQRFVAIEINDRFARMLRERFPLLTLYEENVVNVKSVCDAEGIEGVDAILSGLPWASFSDEEQDRCLDATMSVLREGGQFMTFAYLQGLLLPSAARFRKKLKRYFRQVRLCRPVWANLHPASVYDCRR
jgi:phosphatidylethanolamine/phosphatidyl-N-methylethanolamine N-methyltransferase